MRVIKLRQYTDGRGALCENTLPEIMSNSKHFFISKSKPGVIRGNHYHIHKSEWFYVIQGSCKIVVEDINTKDQEKIIINDVDNSIIFMAPLKAHAFQNTGSDELILLALVNEVFDQKNPDTVPYKVI